jgi:UDP-N-acetylmuramate-alanine ligase
MIADLAKPGGAIVCLGAGSITQWAAGLETALIEREARA